MVGENLPPVSDFVLGSLCPPNHLSFESHIYKNGSLLKKREKKKAKRKKVAVVCISSFFSS
jgi:hypothetical protein